MKKIIVAVICFLLIVIVAVSVGDNHNKPSNKEDLILKALKNEILNRCQDNIEIYTHISIGAAKQASVLRLGTMGDIYEKMKEHIIKIKHTDILSYNETEIQIKAIKDLMEETGRHFKDPANKEYKVELHIIAKILQSRLKEKEAEMEKDKL